MKTINLLSVLLLTTLFITFTSCSSDDNPIAVNEEEVITTVTIKFTSDNDIITLTSRDLDGDGPNAPVLDVDGNFKVNTSYVGAITFLNESQTPAENITNEVKEEGDDHQIFYNAGTLGTFNYSDSDSNNNPIGITFTFVTSSQAGNGTITAILKHEPNKSGSNVSNGDITNAGGSTDVDVNFSVILE